MGGCARIKIFFFSSVWRVGGYKATKFVMTFVIVRILYVLHIP